MTTTLNSFYSQALSRPGNILVVDDDEHIRNALKDFLEHHQHSVTVAIDGPSALAQARTFNPDLLILDAHLPGLDGFEVCRQIKNDPAFVHVSIIMVSGDGDPRWQLRAAEYGANDFVSKPIDFAVLAARVRTMLKYRRAIVGLKMAQDDLERRVRERTEELQQSYSELKKQADERSRAEKALQDVVSKAHCILWDATVARRENGYDWDMRVYASENMRRELNLDPQPHETVGMMWMRILSSASPDQLQRMNETSSAALTAGDSNYQQEFQLTSADGSSRWMAETVDVIPLSDGTWHLVDVDTDITARKNTEAKMLYDSMHDALTGLPNRALLLERLGECIGRGEQDSSYKFAAMVIGIDRFKVINNSMGHLFGDKVLLEIARRISSSVRDCDTVARVGGDEFAVLLDQIDGKRSAQDDATHIQEELSRPVVVDSQEVHVSASIGIAWSTAKYRNAGDALRDADTAMRRAKALGVATNVTFTSGMHKSVFSALQMEVELRKAIERNEFILHYQPIVSLSTNRHRGFEALIRWKKSNGTMFSPAEFIPLAEETGLIVPMSWWVLQEACQQMKKWEGFGAQFVNVNIPSCLFTRPDFVSQIQRTLEETGLAPEKLKLELTESAFMENSETAGTVFNSLKNMNVKLVLDDFGTGYSSLSYLHKFPIDVLKIDRSFIKLIGEPNSKAEIVRTIIMLAQNMKMQVVAEGVETKDQLQHLRELNCHFAQGYLFAKPLDSVAAGEWKHPENIN